MNPSKRACADPFGLEVRAGRVSVIKPMPAFPKTANQWNATADVSTAATQFAHGDSYTGWKRVWAEAGQPEGFCCLPCLERRLKRPLTLEDFPPVPVNRQAYAAAGKLSMVIEREELEKKQRQARISKERERREWMEKHQLKLF